MSRPPSDPGGVDRPCPPGHGPTDQPPLVEVSLSPVQRAALEEDCMLLGVDPWDWRTIPTLRLKYESVAAAAVALRLMDREGRSWTDSLLRTCVHLGLNYETVRKRLGGWHSSARCLPAAWVEPIDAVLE